MPKLIDLLDDRSEKFRKMIYFMLGSIGPSAKPAVPKLVELLQQNSDKDIIWTLREIGPAAKEVVPVLIAALNKPKLAKDAIETLGAMGLDAKAAIPG